MKICILSSRFPWPERGGDYIRTNRVASYLKQQGHQVILVCFNEGEANSMPIQHIYDNIYTLKRNPIETLIHAATFAFRKKPIQCGYYYSYRFKRLFHKVVDKEKPDRYICWLLRMTSYIEEEHLVPQTILEMSDALSKTYSLSDSAKGGWLKRFMYRLEKKPILQYEKEVIRRYPKVVLVAQPDIDYLRSLVTMPVLSLHYHSIGIECVESINISYKTNKICFIGNMRTLQNQDAVLHFVKDIFPLIQEQLPNASFYIVGAEPSKEIKQLAKQKNIYVTGFVNDIQTVINDACLSVAPVQVAAGIQNKVLMAMGCGLPVVMSSLISKAIPQLIDGTNCFIRDNANEFAKSCIELMTNSEQRQLIANRGYEMVKTHYSWDRQLRGYETI